MCVEKQIYIRAVSYTHLDVYKRQDAHAADVKARLLKGTAEVEALRVRVEDVRAAALGQMRRHVAKRRQQKRIERFIGHAVVLDLLAVR